MEIIWIVTIIGWLICGIAGAAILSRYHEEHIGCLPGFLLGPLGLVIAWTMRDSQKHKELLEATGSSPIGSNQQGRHKERNCPFCAELILIEATICKHCRSEVEPELVRNENGEVIEFTGYSETDADLEQLRDMSELETLDLGFCEKITDTGLAHLKEMTNLETLGLSGCEKITDAGLVYLKAMAKLQSVNLLETPITAAGLIHLTGLTKLQGLYLMETPITDAGLVHLKGMTSLRHLALINCLNITDAGLVHLKRLTKLQGLNLYGCQIITDSGVAELQKALPNCEIIR